MPRQTTRSTGKKTFTLWAANGNKIGTVSARNLSEAMDKARSRGAYSVGSGSDKKGNG